MNTIIEAGTMLTAHSTGDWDCIYRVLVLSRTAKTATVKTMYGTKRCGIRVASDGVEYVKAHGNHSMAPLFRADRAE